MRDRRVVAVVNKRGIHAAHNAMRAKRLRGNTLQDCGPCGSWRSLYADFGDSDDDGPRHYNGDFGAAHGRTVRIESLKYAVRWPPDCVTHNT